MVSMGIRQFANSVHTILTNPHIHRPRGLARHLYWQWRKAWDLFPFEQIISTSKIRASHRRCSISALIYSQGLYNYNNMRLLQALLDPGDIFFDIGANIGAYTLLASEREDAQVWAFEPHPDTFQLLAANVALNQRHNVRLFNLAVGNNDGTVYFSDQSGSATNHIVDAQAQQGLTVPSRRIDHLCARHGHCPQYVKLDVEGFEYDVLEGFGSILLEIDLLMIEINGLSDQRSRGQAAIHQLLTSAGLSGPWACDFDRRTFLPMNDHDHEDSLYGSSRFFATAVAKGFARVPTR